MPFLFIRTCDADFESVDDGAHYERAEDALAIGIEGAVGIARDEIQKGARTSAVEIRIEGADGAPVLRSVVAISIASLWVTAQSPTGDT